MRKIETIQMGFTLVELVVMIVIIGILAGVTIVGYGTWQRSVEVKVVQSDLTQGTASLMSFGNFNNNYPPNLAGVQFAPTTKTAMILYTNAPSIGVYQGLTTDQNAQLLLNVCNANLVGSQTVCSFAGTLLGGKIHIKGTTGINTDWISPITQTIITSVLGLLGITYSNSSTTIITQFLAQGGTFPVVISGNTAALPPPSLAPNGPATRFCLEAHASNYPDVVYHTTNSDTSLNSGPCPADPSLHYYTS